MAQRGCGAPHPQVTPGTPGGSAGLELEKAPAVCFGSASDSLLADVAPPRCSGDPPTPSVRTPHPRPRCCLPTQCRTPRGRGWIYPSLLFCRGFIFTSHPALRDSIIRFKYYSAPCPQRTLISQGRGRSCPRVLGRAGTNPTAGRGAAAEGQLGSVFHPRRSRIPREHPDGCGEAALEPAAAPRLLWPPPNSCRTTLSSKNIKN